MKTLLTGNEAIARGAYEAGVRFASAYPGTPSTEILENIAQYKEDIIAEWAPNEKVALEAVIGASFAGARAMASMKHVGVNVAADPLFTLSYLGVNGGLVLVTADEPGHFSSQNEQDNRNYARFAKIPMFEPSDSQEAKDMLKEAFALSEAFDTPVLFRVTTRLCHSKGIVTLEDRQEVAIRDYVKDVPRRVPVPAFVHQMRIRVEERTGRLADHSNRSPLNYIVDNRSTVGVIASGVSYRYAREVFGDTVSYLKLGFTNPLPLGLMRAFADKVDTLYVIEENDPIIENELKMMGIACHGKDVFPYTGEMTPDVIRAALGSGQLPMIQPDSDKVVPRPPTLCAGCPHRGFFYELAKRKNTVIASDIGCYSLGFADPFNATDYLVCMGASISSGHGAQKIFNLKDGEKTTVVSILGDSTFFHTGINSLLNVAYNKGNSISVILDNRITGMTGHQENPGTGYTLHGDRTGDIDFEALVRAMGLSDVRVVNPNDLKAMRETFNWAYALSAAGKPSVIITRWPCALKKFTPEDKAEFINCFEDRCTIQRDVCIGCKACLKVGCPAISFDKEARKSVIDPAACVGCEVCMQVCPTKAIVKEEKA